MITLLRAELLKLRTTRTFAGLAGSALVLSLVIVVLAALLSDSGFTDQDLRELFTDRLGALFIMLLGAMGMAGEWRHRTITGTILAAPDRLRLLAAKVLAYAAAGALLSLLVTVSMMLLGAVLLPSDGEQSLALSAAADVLWRNMLVALLLGALGVCIGGLVRSQVAAIVGLLVFSLVAEPALFSFIPDVGRFLPLSNVPHEIAGISTPDDAKPLSDGVAVLVMVGWVAACATVTGTLLRRRDLV